MSKTPVFNVVREGDAHVFEFLSDNLDPAAIEAASDEIPKLIGDQNINKLVLDLSRVTFVPSRVLGVLLEVNQVLTQRKGQLRVCGLRPMILNVFKFTKLDTVLKIEPDRAAAIKSLM